MAQSLAASAFAGTAEKKCVVVDYYLTTIVRKSQKAVLPSVFNAFREVRQFAANPLKTRKTLKMQHFIRLRLKTPTVDIAPVKLYPYVKKQDANSCI